MTRQDYSASITANITPQEATERINRVADWWTASFTGASGKVGDAFTVRFGETFVDFAVVELVPARRIVWRVTDCNLHFVGDKEEWKDTRVVFDIASDGPATTVTMTHAGLVPGIECYENCEKGWDFYVRESLQKLLRENQGIPDGRRRQESAQSNPKGTMALRNDDREKIGEYAPVNGLKMYYEIEGSGHPLVYIPPAFGFAGLNSFPVLLQSHSVITVDLQGNGRTADIPDRQISIEQYAKDVVGLLKYLEISKADFFGESYGGATAAMIAVRYPDFVGRVATYGATFGPSQVALNPQTTHSDHPPNAESRYIRFQRENYRRVAPDPDYWPKIFDKVGNIEWGGFSKEELGSIKAPILIILGDHDFVRLEHAVETFNLIPNAELAVIPDASHFVLFSEQERVIPIVEHFLEKPENRIPLATGRTGYHAGETR